MAESYGLGCGVVDFVRGNAIVYGTGDEILVEELHVPLCDALDEKSRDRARPGYAADSSLLFWRF